MSKEKFLLYMLAGIFVFQGSLFTYGFYQCTQIRPELEIREVCPEIGDRYEATFNLMVATTLALLTGSAITKGE